MGNIRFARSSRIWVWRSLVACLNGVQEAGGSNPLTQTKSLVKGTLQGFFCGERIMNNAGRNEAFPIAKKPLSTGVEYFDNDALGNNTTLSIPEIRNKR